MPDDDVLSRYDVELHRLDPVFRGAWNIKPHHHVLEIGCGEGRTTRSAARAAHDGSALGIDVSRDAIERARVAAHSVANVRFEVADAQTDEFDGQRFDVAISRFGTMFFADASAAFANIRQALRPRGRLVMMVWQPADQNEWDAEIHRALTGRRGDRATALPGLDPFSLGDPPAVRSLLAGAGFEQIEFVDVREPVLYGRDVDDALEFVRGFSCTRELLKGTDEDVALDRLRTMLVAHRCRDGVWFDSAAWLVTARRG